MFNTHVHLARDLQARNWHPGAIAREVARAARAEGLAAEVDEESDRPTVTFLPSYRTVELSRLGAWVLACARMAKPPAAPGVVLAGQSFPRAARGTAGARRVPERHDWAVTRVPGGADRREQAG